MCIHDTNLDETTIHGAPATDRESLASLEVSNDGQKTFAETFMEVCEGLPTKEQALIEESLCDLADAEHCYGSDAVCYANTPELTGSAEIDLAILGGCTTSPPEFESVDIDPDGDTYVTRAQVGEFFLAADGRFGYRVTLPDQEQVTEVTLLPPDKNVFALCIDQIVHFGTTLMNQKWFFVVRGPSIGGVSDTLDFVFDPIKASAEDIRVYDGTPVQQNTVLFGALPADVEYVDETGEDGEVVSYVKNVAKIFTAGYPQSFVEMLEKFVVLATVHGHRMSQPVIRVEAPHDLTKAPTFGGAPIVEGDDDELSSVDFSGATD